MGKMKDLSILIEELLDMDLDYQQIVERVMADSYLSPEDAMEMIMDAEMRLAIRYKDLEDYDDSMDGDHASALASAGWGTDEDYGYASDDY